MYAGECLFVQVPHRQTANPRYRGPGDSRLTLGAAGPRTSGPLVKSKGDVSTFHQGITMAKNHYGEVTNRILAQLEAGTPPWVKRACSSAEGRGRGGCFARICGGRRRARFLDSPRRSF